MVWFRQILGFSPFRLWFSQVSSHLLLALPGQFTELASVQDFWTNLVHTWRKTMCSMHYRKPEWGSVSTARRVGRASLICEERFSVVLKQCVRGQFGRLTDSLLNSARIFGRREPLMWMWTRVRKQLQRTGSQGVPNKHIAPSDEGQPENELTP